MDKTTRDRIVALGKAARTRGLDLILEDRHLLRSYVPEILRALREGEIWKARMLLRGRWLLPDNIGEEAMISLLENVVGDIIAEGTASTR